MVLPGSIRIVEKSDVGVCETPYVCIHATGKSAISISAYQGFELVHNRASFSHVQSRKEGPCNMNQTDVLLVFLSIFQFLDSPINESVVVGSEVVEKQLLDIVVCRTPLNNSSVREGLILHDSDRLVDMVSWIEEDDTMSVLHTNPDTQQDVLD